MRVGKVAVLLFNRRLVRAHGLFNLASRVERVAEVVVGFGIAASPLLDRGFI